MADIFNVLNGIWETIQLIGDRIVQFFKYLILLIQAILNASTTVFVYLGQFCPPQILSLVLLCMVLSIATTLIILLK